MTKPVLANGFDVRSLQPILHDPDFCLETTCELFFKSKIGDSTTVGVTALNGERYVIKRYNSKGVLHDVLSQFRMSRAKRNWLFSLELQRIGVPVVPPVALLEKRIGPIKTRAYFISRYMPGVEAAQYFSDDNPAQEHWSAVLKKIASISQQLKKAKIKHRDFQPGNVLIMNHEPFLLDFDYLFKINRSDAAFEKIHQRQIKCFLRNLSHSPTAKAMFAAELQALGDNV